MSTPLPPSDSPLVPIVVVVFAADDQAALKALAMELPTPSSLALILLPLDAGAQEVGRALLRDRPVRDAQDGDALARGQVLMVAPGTSLTFIGNRVHLAAKPAEPAHLYDDALVSLAEGHGEHGTAIILHGAVTAVDEGAMTLLEAGGGVLLQDEAGSASQAGVRPNGQVIPAAQLASHLLARIARVSGPSAPVHLTAEDLAQVLALVGAKTGVDFSDYKKSTLRRRIQRRMGISQIPTAAAYLSLLEESPNEAAILHREMLIGVTRFFRDPEAYALLAEKVIAPLFANPSRKEPVRIWVAGCASGEEAYSVAILVREALAAAGTNVPAKIFATDLDRDAIDAASLGVYPASIAEDLSPERLEQNFVRRGDGWQVAKPVRELVVFAHHNIARDPPFFRMDLVTCRNLLIYLQPALQRRLFNAFHFALGAAGHLLLGTSETLGEMAAYFTPVDVRWKLYRKLGERVPRMSESIFPDRLGSRTRAAPPPEQTRPPLPSESLQDAIHQTLLTELAPAFLVADGDFEIHYTSGALGRYLTLPRGRPTFNLLRMAPRELAVALSTGIRRALREKSAVVYDEIELSGGDPGRVRLSIRPLPQRADIGNLVAVVFEEPDDRKRRDGEHFDLAAQTDQRIVDLENELEHSRESLQAAIEELETSNEELQATNEELLAANEELQSTNEELQSVNEELYTVNAEHQAKIAELTELNDDILNLLGSSNIGTVFLDRNLRVRKFTRAATAQINLIDKDIGRPLAHISNNIEYADLTNDAEEVLRTLIPKQRRVCTREGQWHLMRILPYRTEDNVIKGVVITFIDIAEIILAGEQVRALTTTIERTSSLITVTSEEGSIIYVNQRFADVTGWKTEEVIGRNERFLRQSGPEAEAKAAELERTMAAGMVWTGQLLSQRRDGQPYIEDALVVPLRDANGRPATRLKIASCSPPGWKP